MPSVVIAAHNEGAVIGRCLAALLREGVSATDIVVVANGCTDDTVLRASEFGVTVVNRSEPGKAAAMNAGDDAATAYPRLYLDADIVVPPGAMAAIDEAFGRVPHPLAVVPRRNVALTDRPWPVRAYFTVNRRLPAFQDGLFGRGLIALSEQGRSRFDRFPELVADDLYLDAQFTAAEKAVAGFDVVVEVPFTTRDLLNRLVRVRRGNAELRAAASSGGVDASVRTSSRWAWVHVVAGHPSLWASGAVYAVLTITAELRARSRRDIPWGHDESTRDTARLDSED